MHTYEVGKNGNYIINTEQVKPKMETPFDLNSDFFLWQCALSPNNTKTKKIMVKKAIGKCIEKTLRKDSIINKSKMQQRGCCRGRKRGGSLFTNLFGGTPPKPADIYNETGYYDDPIIYSMVQQSVIVRTCTPTKTGSLKKKLGKT